MTQWYYSDYQRNRHGPVGANDLATLHANGQLSPDTLVWREGLAQWQPWRTVMGEVVPGAGPPAMAEVTFATAASDAPAHATANPYAIAEPRSPYAPPSAPLLQGTDIHLDADVVYAGFWKRVAAYMIDALALAILSYAVQIPLFLMVFGSMRMNAAKPDFGGGAALVLVAAYLVPIAIQVVYYAWFHSSGHQATPGKMAIGIKVVGEGGRRISFAHGIGRYFAFLLSSFTIGIGYAMAAFTDRKRALHDMVASTLVVDRWAFTGNPEFQRRELGTVTIVMLVMGGLVLAGMIVVMTMMIGVIAARGVH